MPALLVFPEVTTDYQLISGLIYKISRYSSWPRQIDSTKPFTIAVIGKLPRGEQIYLSREANIEKRPVQVQYISSLEEIKSQEVLFIASSESRHLESILNYTRRKPILTIGDTREFGQRGVIINFFLKGKQRMGYEVNYESYLESGIQIHSNVLANGLIIDPKHLRENSNKTFGKAGDSK
jgi:hypothetical protein